MEDPLPAHTGFTAAGALLLSGTPTGVVIKIVVLVLLVMLSAFFSSAETAFTGVNRVKLKNLAADGNRRAKTAMSLVEKFDTMLYATLIGNNIVNIAASSIATLLFIDLLNGNQGLGSTIATVVLTVILLIFGEITPKTLAKMSPEKFATAFCHFVYFFVIILTPLCKLFELWKKLILKIFKVKPDEGITEQELLTIVEEAGEEGSLDDNETHLIRSAIEFNDLDVEDIYVPRVNVIAIEKNTPMEEIRALFAEHSFSRMPVYEDNIDHIVGMLHEKDFYAAVANGQKNIANCISKIALATEHMKISTLLKSLQKQKIHMAVVVDEYGGTCGIVTLEDILEELVGEIWDEHDEVVNYFDKISDDMYIVDGNAEIDDFFELFSIEEPEGEECDANTVGGWVCEKLENIPNVNDSFVYGNLRVTVLETEQTRVLAVRVEILPPEKTDEEE
ncbi:MAG: HlyC/CorC family transporter [Clostridia bacterium]|nr:HlyC/CorC family transporter [Clostridia bacterium]